MRLLEAIAEQEGLNLIAAPGDEKAKIGVVYKLESPQNKSDLASYRKKGTPVKPLYSSDGVRIPTDHLNLISKRKYTITQSNVKYLLGDLSDLIRASEIKVSAKALRQAITAMGISFRVEVWAFDEKRLRELLRQQGYANFPVPEGANGIFTSHIVARISDFKYNRTSLSQTSGELALKLVDVFEANFKGMGADITATVTERDGSAVFAFYPVIIKWRQ